MRRVRVMGGLLFCVLAVRLAAQEPPWNPAAVKECDRACLVGIMDGYMNAIFKKDPKAVPPLALDVRMTENTGQMDVARAYSGDRTPSRRRSRSTSLAGC